ncbi:MAG TPA: tetratricopeptide repeat protein [Bacteroidales bacterium]|nr:tetratricopeptide repeat protein [Bacteroidales bacterium]HPW78545.1 tetratricopeptide repeat protein [Bacteroidales bacterium]HQB55756.1 tetratricopeptide repeat protein [Bacteroidales bacterium]
MWKRVLLFMSLVVVTACGYRAGITAEESQILFHQGLKMFYLGDMLRAWDCFQRVVSRDKDNDAAFYYLVQIAGYAGRWEEANANLQKALKLQPNNYWYRLQEAKLAIASGNPEKAESLYEILWRDYPNKTELLYDRIGLYMNGKKTARALELLDTLEGMDGVHESSLLLRFNLLMQNDREEAVKMLNDHAVDNSTPRVLSILGDLEAEEDRIDKANEYYQRALEIDPIFMPAVFGLAETYRMRRQFDLYFENINVFLAYPDIEARMKTDYLKQILDARGFVTTFQPQVDTLFRSTRSAHPADSSLAYIYAGYLVQTQRPEQAKEVMTENLDHYPYDYLAWYQTLGLIYYLKDWPLLCDYGARALEVFRNDVDFGSLYGLALWQTGKIGEAVSRFELILSLLKKEDIKNKIQTMSLLGDLYHEKGDWKRSFRLYEKVLRLDRENLPVLNNYAYFLSLRKEKLEKALSMSSITIEKEPNNSTYLDTYGWILHQLGRSAEAKNVLRQALAYGGKESAEILDHYGDVLNALNEPLMAIVYWQQAYDIEPREEILLKIETNKKTGQ